MFRTIAKVGASYLTLLTGLTVLAGCQLVVDFDDARICTDDQQVPLNCFDPSLAPPGTILACVSPSCDRSSGQCAYPANPSVNGIPCEDPDPCTSNTTCLDGACVGDRSPDGTQCDFNPCEPGFCEAGVCVKEILAVGAPCDDGDICSTNTVCRRIETSTGEVFTNCTGDTDPDFDGEPCDDGDPCTTGSVCFAGLCTGSPACVSGEACDAETGVCTCGESGGSCKRGEVCDDILGLCSCNEGSPCAEGEICRRNVGCEPG